MDSEEEIVSLFRDINSAEPVRLVDMPGTLLDDNGDDSAYEDATPAPDHVDEIAEESHFLQGSEPPLSIPPVQPPSEVLLQAAHSSDDGLPLLEVSSVSTSPLTEVSPLPSSVETKVEAETVKVKKTKSRKSKKEKENVNPKALEQLQRSVLEEVAFSLKKTYPEAFKDTQKCRPPFVNLDVVRDELFQSRSIYFSVQILLIPDPFHGRYIRDLTLTNEDVMIQQDKVVTNLIARIAEVNQQIRDEEVERQKTTKPMNKSQLNTWNKATSLSFFLGIRKGWTDLL